MAVLGDFYDPFSAVDRRTNNLYGAKPSILDDPLSAMQHSLYGKPVPLPDNQAEAPDDESLLDELANKGMSALQYVGETLDKTFGGRTIRGLLGGEGPAALAHLIPFSDSLGLTDDRGLLGSNLIANKNDVPSGRGLLEQAGILDKKTEPGFDLGDVAGMAAEIGLDPASWLSGGATALEKSAGGQIATKALGESGLLDALTQRVGSTLSVGPREGAIRTTLSDLLSRVPEARSAMETAAGGSDALETALSSQQPLGALARVHLPFMPSAGVNIGTGESAANLGGLLDQLREGVRYSAPGRVGASLFSYPSRGVLSKEGQLARQAATAGTTSAVADATGDLLPHIRAFEDAGLAGPEGASMLNDVFEGLKELPPEHAALQPNVDAVKASLAQMPQDYKDLGLNLNEWDSKWSDYLPRQTAPDADRTFKAARAVPAGDQFQNARLAAFDVPGGKNMLNEISTDALVSGPNRELGAVSVDDVPAVKSAEARYQQALVDFGAGATDQASVVKAKQAAITAKESAINDVAAQHIREAHYPDWKEKAWTDAQEQYTQAKRAVANERLSLEPNANAIQDAETRLASAKSIYDPRQAIVDQSKQLASVMANLDPRHALNSEPLFPNHPLTDILTRVKAAERTKAATQGAYKFLSDYAIPGGAEADSTPVKDILNQMGLSYNTQPDPLVKQLAGAAKAAGIPLQDAVQQAGVDLSQLPYTGAIKQMAQKLGTTPDDVLNYRVPNDIASDATRMVKTFQSPEAVKVVLNKLDKFEQWFKTWVTQPFSGFHVRNKATAMVGDLIGGIAPSSLAKNQIDATNLLRGQTIKGLASSVPYFAGMTDEEATKTLANLAAKHGLYRTGQIAQDIAPEAQTVANIIPGVVPQTFGSAAKTFLPDVVRGIESEGGLMGALKSVAPHPALAGQNIGNILEDGNRISSFLGFMRQGYDEAAAAAKSKVIHGDYGALTDFEKSVMKRLIPFYSFNKLVLPNFIDDVLKNPGGITAQAVRTENRLNQQSGYVPPYISKGLAVPLGESAPGTMKYLTSSGILPIENLNDLVKFGTSPLDTAKQTGEAILGQTNPLLKGPLELMTGKQLYTDRDLKDLQTHFGLPPFIEQIVMNSPAARVLSSVSKLGDDRKSLPEKLLNLTTGIRTADVNIDKSKDIAAAEAIRDMMAGQPGAHIGTPDLYVDKQSLASMSPDSQKLYQLYGGIQKRAQQRAKLAKQQNSLTGAGR